MGRILLAELTSTFRSFDSEHEKSIKVLNKAIEMISSKLELVHPLWQRPEDVPLIREVDSRAIDEIQAADIAAGWAREIIDTASSKALGVRFERVWLNGRRVK